MKLNKERVENIMGFLYDKACDMTHDKNTLISVIDRIESKLPESLEEVGGLGVDLLLLISLLKDYIVGDYRNISRQTYTMIISVIIYFASGAKIVPNFLKNKGKLDGAYAVKLLIDIAGDEVDNYRVWLYEERGEVIDQTTVEGILNQDKPDYSYSNYSDDDFKHSRYGDGEEVVKTNEEVGKFVW